MVMRYTNFRSWNQFCEEIKSLSKMSWWEEKETAQITENAPCKFPSTYTFKVSQLLCQNSLLLLAAILHSLVHPTYAMYYPVKILILQKLNLCKVSKKTYMYDDKESWNEFKLTHIPVNTNWLWNHCTLWIYIISKWAKKKPSLFKIFLDQKIKPPYRESTLFVSALFEDLLYLDKIWKSEMRQM